MSELTSANLNLMPEKKKRTRRTGKNAIRHRKAFAKAYLKTCGNQTKAYMLVHPDAKYNSAKKEAYRMMRHPEVRNEIAELLDEQGMPRDYFLQKMKDLAEVKDAKGNPIASVQWDVVKTGLEFHGIIKKGGNSDRPQIQVNYNLDAEKLGGVLSKLSEVTKKLELSNLNRGVVTDAIIEEQPADEAS